MNKYYNCIVKYLKLSFDKKGAQKYKLIKDEYLVLASTVTQAQSILKQNIDGIYTSPEIQECEVISIKQSKIINIFEKINNLFSE